MKTVLKAVGMLAIAAGTASADIRLDLPSNHIMLPASAVTANALDAGGSTRGTPVYSSIPGPYSALANGAFAQRDDYVSVHPATGSGNFIMDAFQFAGGVTAVGGILDIFFLDAGLNVVSSFGVTLGSAGDFIWTITPTVPAPAAIGGFMQIQTRTGTTGRWFATSTPAAPGSNSFASGHGSTFSSGPKIASFQLQALPAPGAAALLGLGGLVATRRRR